MAVKKVNVKKISPAFSMAFWDLITYVKDRKKGIIAITGALIASWLGISDIELINILLGVVFEGAVSVAVYYVKPVEVE